MAGRGEIQWKSRGPDGERIQVRARKRGERWEFYRRARRFERWSSWPDPPREEWLRLLDAIERRVSRRLFPPEEPERLRARLDRLFPESEGLTSGGAAGAQSARRSGDPAGGTPPRR